MQLTKLIEQIENRMRLDLEIIREKYTKSGEKGYWVENIFREFLHNYLPASYRIGHGEIIDSEGHVSAQTDIIISNEYHPFINREEMPGTYFIEGVCAVGEAKTTLTNSEKSGLPRILQNSHQFKQLEMKLKKSLINTNESDKKRFYRCPPWFLIAFESNMTLAKIQSEIQEFEKKHNITDNRLVDAVFVLDKGWIINFGDGQGSFKWVENNKSQTGWVSQMKRNSSALYMFLTWLCAVMPRTVQFEPILIQYLIPPEQTKR